MICLLFISPALCHTSSLSFIVLSMYYWCCAGSWLFDCHLASVFRTKESPARKALRIPTSVSDLPHFPEIDALPIRVALESTRLDRRW